MAHAAQLNLLTDDLVEIIAGYTPENNVRAFKVCKEAASKNLKSNRFGRTNQFSVRSSLQGLVEKFQILNNDPLADQLQLCLDGLDTKTYEWKPEVLSLLLLLSDKPVEKTHANSTETSESPEEPLPLTWADILADDPITDKDLWRDVDRGVPDLSEDEISLDYTLGSDRTDVTSPPTEATIDNAVSVESLVVAVETNFISKLQQAPRSREKLNGCGSSVITELQAIRGVLHMLLGLPSIFTVTGRATELHPYVLEECSQSSVGGVLTVFTSVAQSLDFLRRYTIRSHSIPLLQSFGASVSRWIENLDTEIASMEQRFVSIKKPCTVSILKVYTEINVHTDLIHLLHEITAMVDRLPADQSFRLLDELFDRVCLAEVLGDHRQFRVIANIFFACLQTYMRPLSAWMEEGYLHPNDILCPFTITQNDNLSTLWNDRYAICKTDGKYKAPRFIHELLEKIFASGKDVAFSSALGLADVIAGTPASLDTSLASEELYGIGSEMTLSPFSARLNDAVLVWVTSKCQQTWSILQNHLLQRHGLWRTITALEVLYLSRNGSISQAFSDAIFERLDADTAGWDDAMFVEELAIQLFGSSEFVDHAGINAMRDQKNPSSHRKTMKGLASIVLTYHYAWPIENIIPPATLRSYQNVFTFLLQITRARTLLSRQSLHVYSSLSKKPYEPRYPAAINRHSIRHRLLWLVGTLQDYMFNSAIAPASHGLRAAMELANNVDAMIEAHSNFITRVEASCLLRSETASAYEAIISLLDLVVLFTDVDSIYSGGTISSSHRQQESQVKDKNVIESTGAPRSSIAAHEDGNGKGSQPVSSNPGIDIAQQLRQITTQYQKLLAYVINGLRSAGRTPRAVPAWEVLAEMLEFGTVGAF